MKNNNKNHLDLVFFRMRENQENEDVLFLVYKRCYLKYFFTISEIEKKSLDHIWYM